MQRPRTATVGGAHEARAVGAVLAVDQVGRAGGVGDGLQEAGHLLVAHVPGGHGDGHHGDLVQVREGPECGLDLAELDPVAPALDLAVGPAHEVDPPVLAVDPGQVPRPVDPLREPGLR